MDLSNFTIVTGLASLLGFVIQLADLFPRHQDLRTITVTLVCGVFLGSLFSAFDASNISFSFTITPYVLLVGSIVMALLIVLLTAVFSYDRSKRGEMYGVLSFGALFLFFMLIAGSIPSIDHEGDRIRNEKSGLSISELLKLSDISLDSGNYDRALMHLETVKRRLEETDSRHAKIIARIKEVKELQL